MALLDTHALLWWTSAPDRLSRRALTTIARADPILVSPISFFEIASLTRKGRIRLDRDTSRWVHDLLSQDGVGIVEIRPAVATAAGRLDDGFPGGPADRLLYASAVDAGVPLVTKDRGIRAWARDSGRVPAVW